MKLELTDLLKNVYYGTTRQIIEDLVEQVNDYMDNSPDKDDLKKVDKFLELIKQALLIYCGEGGVELKYTKFEVFTKKYLPEIVENLRK